MPSRRVQQQNCNIIECRFSRILSDLSRCIPRNIMAEGTIPYLAFLVLMTMCAGVYSHETLKAYDICGSRIEQELDLSIHNSSHSFYLTSPGYLYEHHYDDALYCTVSFYTQDSAIALKLEALNFALENHTECSYDSLLTPYVRLCGEWDIPPLEYLVCPHSNFELTFKTDGSQTRAGFRLLVTSQPYSHNRAVLTYTGPGFTKGDSYTPITCEGIDVTTAPTDLMTTMNVDFSTNSTGEENNQSSTQSYQYQSSTSGSNYEQPSTENISIPSSSPFHITGRPGSLLNIMASQEGMAIAKRIYDMNLASQNNIGKANSLLFDLVIKASLNGDPNPLPNHD